MKKILVALSVLLLATSAGAVWLGMQIATYMQTPLTGVTVDAVEIASGSSLKSVARQLGLSGVIAHPQWFAWYARYRGYSTIRAGEYHLANTMTPVQLLKDMHDGKVIHHQVTLVDGHTFRQVMQLLQAEPRLQKKLAGLGLAEIAAKLGLQHDHPEGLIFPDSYEYVLGMSDEDVLREGVRKMQQVVQEEWEKRDPDVPYRDAYDALIMASIVEKETAVPDERADIAGVFVRRLLKGMMLQTDPTVIYGLGDAYDGNLTRKDLQSDTPYNTYTRAGLPPTPIALPGRAAIHAALHPAAGDALYFVARGDGHHQVLGVRERLEEAAFLLLEGEDRDEGRPRPGGCLRRCRGCRRRSPR